jgi:L-fuculose-phosphate aldolase
MATHCLHGFFRSLAGPFPEKQKLLAMRAREVYPSRIMILSDERKAIVAFGRKMLASRLTTGSGGNLSVLNRRERLLAITPSGIEYTDLEPEQVLVLDPGGSLVDGYGKPSSETGLHLALYHCRTDVCAVVHTHSVYATTYACLNREIPAVHYLVGFSGNKVPLAPYATYGTPELASAVAGRIGGYNAVLMANHGLVAVGPTLARAFNTAEEIELVARICYQAESIGTPVILPDDEMERVIQRFAGYGPKETGDAP